MGLAIDLSTGMLVSLQPERCLSDLVAKVDQAIELIDDALCLSIVFVGVSLRPPIAQIALRVEATALVIENDVLQVLPNGAVESQIMKSAQDSLDPGPLGSVPADLLDFQEPKLLQTTTDQLGRFFG